MIIFDVEVALNFFCVTFKEFSKPERHTFEISERKNDFLILKNYLEQLNTKETKLAGFNNLHYDEPILAALYAYNENLYYKEICAHLFWVSMEITTLEEWWRKKELSHLKSSWNWITVDIYRFWSKKERIDKKISLKTLGVQIGYPNITDLPFNYLLPVQVSDIPVILKYNAIQDIDLVEWLLEKKKFDVQLRDTIYNKYGFLAYHLSAPSIGTTYLKNKMVAIVGNDKFTSLQTKRTSVRVIDILDPNIQISGCYKDIYEKLKKATITASPMEFSLQLINPDGTRLKTDVKKGGIHGVIETPCVITKKDDEELMDLDIGSQYPGYIIAREIKPEHLPESFVKIYTEIRDERLENKSKSKDKSIEEKLRNEHLTSSEVLKIALNSVAGGFQMEGGWLHDPKCFFQITINCQMMIIDITEKFLENGISVLYQNTDGLLIRYKKSKSHIVKELLEEHSSRFKCLWESKSYEKIFLYNVSNYLAIDSYGEIKTKGVIFVTSPKLGDSSNNLVIPKAIQAFLVNNTPIKEFVHNHNNELDFLACGKSSKKFSIYYNNEEIQRVNRYYRSAKGLPIFKSEDGVKMSLIPGADKITIHNDLSAPITNLDYDWYIKKANEVCNTFFENKVKQGLLF